MHDLSNWERLDAASYRVTVLRSLRQAGWISVVMGGISVAIAVVPPVTPALLAIGAMLVVTGFWNVVKPSPAGLVVDGASVIALGIFNGLSLLGAPSEHAAQAVRWAIFGLFQIGWGVQRISRYPTARTALGDPESIQQLQAVVQELAKRKAKQDPGVVEFTTSGLRAKRHRVGLYPEGAVALLDNYEVIRLARRDEISVENRGKTFLGRGTKVTVRLGDRELKGTMPGEHYERFENWKLGVVRPVAIAA